MTDKLTVVMGGEPAIEYDRAKPLSGSQLEYLQNLDRRMEDGISLAGKQVDAPDQLQRAQFIALHLVQAVREGDEARAAASCSYLAVRIPDLKQVNVVEKPGHDPLIDLVFDKAWAPQATVQFIDPGKKA